MFPTFLSTPACGRQGIGRRLIDILGKKGKVRTENGSEFWRALTPDTLRYRAGVLM